MQQVIGSSLALSLSAQSSIQLRAATLAPLMMCLIVASPALGGDEVSIWLYDEERAFVVVTLESGSWSVAVTEQMRHTELLQEEALRGPLREGFEVTHQYSTVPALSGWITSHGLSRVQADINSQRPVIRAISLDASGGGEPLLLDGGSGGLADTVPLIDAHVVHSWGFSGAGVEVAILDTGIDTDHPDLASSLLTEQCFCFNPSGHCCPNGQSTQSGAGSAEDDNGHGSHVSGIVTSDGVVASVGVAPDAGITMIKMLDSNNSFFSSSDIVAGLDWLNVNRPEVAVVSMSLQTSATFADVCDNSAAWTQALYTAVQNLVAKGVVVVAIAGNYSLADQMVAPGCLSNVFNVGATDKFDVAASFSNSHALVDVFAPGVSVVSDWPGGTTATASGTSMACPHVSGLSALILEADSTLDRDALATAMTSTGVAVTDWNGITHPRIDADDAFTFALGSVFTDSFESGDTSAWSSSVP